MFKIGDKVVHSREGLSCVVNIVKMGDNDYFVVNSLKGKGENIYVLTTRTENIIRPIMNKEEALKVIDYMKQVKAEFISNTKQRRDQYKRRLLSGNVLDLAYLSRQLYFFYYYNEHGEVVKLGPTDIQMLKDAESILFDEFALSFEIEREKIEAHVRELLA